MDVSEVCFLLDTRDLLSYHKHVFITLNHMNIAVIETGGKQYLVTDQSKLTVEKITGAQVGQSVSFDKVLLMDDGALTLGAPYITNASIDASYDIEGRNKKIVVVKYKAKSRYHKKRGHKQPHAKVTIKKVS